jgi:SAM-dependent methyltransferase
VNGAAAKQRLKQAVRRTIGEPYVGKRLKLRNLNAVLRGFSAAPKSILDAGAGDATFVYWLADRFQRGAVTAVDVDAAAMAACQDALPKKYASRVSFVAATFDTLPSAAFDLITAFDVLEHIPDDVSAVRHLARALRPGGYFLVHVPRNVWTHRDGRQERVPDDEAWRINPGHVRMGYSPEQLQGLVESEGLEVADVRIWLRRWGVVAHEAYARVERFKMLRLLTLPVTDLAAVLDRRRPAEEGNTVFLLARKPLGTVEAAVAVNTDAC